MKTFKIRHEEHTNQFVTEVEGTTAVLQYKKLSDNTLEYYKTFVPPEARHHQVGGQLVEYALQYAKENNFKIKPTCSFVKWYLEQHPEYHGLIA